MLMTPWLATEKQTDAKREGIYHEVPTERRQSLEQAVNLLVEKEKVGDWKGVYALIDKPHTESEESFREKNESLRRLREFRPSKVTFIPPDDSWSIEGCAAFAGDLNGQGRVADLHAHWRDSRWYLSMISLELFGSEKGGEVRKCSMQQAGRPS
jgi:hypothetical protein